MRSSGLWGAPPERETDAGRRVGWGRGDNDLSLVGGDPVTGSYRSERLTVPGDATGDFGWGGAGWLGLRRKAAQ